MTDQTETAVLAESIVDAVGQPLVVLNGDLRVSSANRAFCELCEAERGAIEGRPLDEIGGRRWDVLALREALSALAAQGGAGEAVELRQADEGGGERVLLFSARPLAPAGQPPLILLAIDDVTEQRRSAWLLEHQKDLAEKIVDTVREPLLVLHRDLRVASANESFYATFGVARGETEGRLVYELGAGQWDIPELRRLLSEILPDNDFFEDFEVEHDFPGIGRRAMLLNARRVNHLQLILLAIEDVTERRRAERERELLVAELNHRVKNLLAVVRALITQGDGVRSAEDYRVVLLGRLDALARTHDLLFESHWRGAELGAIASTLQPFAGQRSDAIEIDGAPVELNARQALSISLVLHELATNAAKYGALSTPAGRVRLWWRSEPAGEGRRLRLCWQERGGPPVSAPRRTGFGTNLIRRAFGFELDGTADLAFEPEGLRLEATFPLS